MYLLQYHFLNKGECVTSFEFSDAVAENARTVALGSFHI